MNSKQTLLVLVITMAAGAALMTVWFARHSIEPSVPELVLPRSQAEPSKQQLSPALELTSAPALDTRDALNTASETSAEAPAADTVPALSPQETWAVKYAGKTSKDLRRLREELNAEIGKLAVPEFNRMYEAGRYEVLHRADEPDTGKDWDPDLVMSLRTPPWTAAGPAPEVQRVVLAERTYPELYLMRDEERWLDKRYYEVQRQEMERKTAAAPR